MPEPITTAAAVKAGLDFFGGQAETATKADIAMKERHRLKRTQQARERAFANLLATGKDLAQSGEEQLLKETAAPLEELTAVQEGITAGTTEGQQIAQDELRAGATSSGIRGGQLAELLKRQAGSTGVNLQEQLNQLGLKEAERRRTIRTGFAQQKAGVGQQAQVTPAPF